MTGRRITLGAVTVDSGIATGFLGGETVALQAVIDRVNADGGVCGKELVLETRDSGWEPNAGYEAIRDLSDEVLALVVNPDSNGLSLASLREACNEEPACDARAIAGLPSTVVNWLARGGAGVVAKTAGAVAVPPLLFHEDFAQSCGRDCDRLRLWTAFRPPIHPFLGEPAVARYVNDMRVVSSYVDVENQHTQGAYVGAELAVHALRHAAARPGGITRENVAHVLATTTNWDSGLTVAPLSWSPGEHNAATTLHAYDIRFSPTTATVEFWYVDGSRRTSPA